MTAPNRPAGQVAIIAAVLLSSVLALATAAISLNLASSRVAYRIGRSRAAIQAASAGIDRALWCLGQSDSATCGGNPGSSYGGENGIMLGNARVDIAVTSIDAATKSVESTALVGPVREKIKATAKLREDHIYFLYATHIGEGGIEMEKNATINGSVYSNGDIEGDNGTEVNGDAVSAGTKLDKIKVSGTARADAISNSTVTGDAYYKTLTKTTVGGTKYPNSPTPAKVPLPVTQEMIAAWRRDARSGGVINGDYAPPGGSVTSLGPVLITGDLLLDNNQTVILAGTVFVDGNIDIDNNAAIRLNPAYGSHSGLIAAEGTIHLSNNGEFQGAAPGSYVMFLSNATGGGHHDSAMDLHNNAAGTIFYATRGLINLHNGVEVAALSAYKVSLSNNAVINYEQPLSDVIVVSSPAGYWTLEKDSWRQLP